MWIFMPDAFVSIAEHADDSRLLTIRARIQGDIERVFPEAQVMETPTDDYLFRASLSRERVAQVISNKLLHTRYQSVSGAVEDTSRWTTYVGVLTAMQEEQIRRSDLTLDLEPRVGHFDLDES